MQDPGPSAAYQRRRQTAPPAGSSEPDRTPGDAGDALAERDSELQRLDADLRNARQGRGGTVFVEGPIGIGKSALLSAAEGRALQTGMHVLHARARELERELPLGIAAQLLSSPPAGAPTPDAAAPQSPTRVAEELEPVLRAAADPGLAAGERAFTAIRHLFAVTTSLVVTDSGAPTGRSLALLIDDAHWADEPSCRFLAYLAARLAQLPIVVIVAARPDDCGRDPVALDALRAAAAVLRPQPLSEQAVGALLGTRAPAGPDGVREVLVRSTGGNPWLVEAMLAELDRDGPPDESTPSRLEERVAEAIGARVRFELRTMPEPAAALAHVVAATGAPVPLARAAALAGLDPVAASRAADALAAAGLFAAGDPLQFAQPLVALAVAASLPALERERLRRLGAAPSPDEGGGTAVDRSSPRLELVPSRAHALVDRGRFAEAARILEDALDRVTPQGPGDADELERAYFAATAFVPELFDAAGERARAVLGSAEPASLPTRCSAAAHLAIQGSLRGEHRDRVLELATLAGDWDVLLNAARADATVVARLGGALLIADELERALELCQSLESEPPGQQPRWAHAGIGYARAWSLFHRGQLTEAATAAESILAAAPDAEAAAGVGGALAAARLELGQLDLADAALAPRDRPAGAGEIEIPALLETRAQLRLAQTRHAEALDDALEAGRRAASPIGAAPPGILTWRSTAALAHMALNRRADATALVEEELQLARRAGATRVITRDLRVLGLLKTGQSRLSLLGEAAQTGETGPVRLEHIHALVDYGSALRRANHRSAARAPLRRALELCDSLGPMALALRAQQELAASGGRLQHRTMTGIDALTPSERRVADLAADGHTTRQIASQLFVTPKTVEFHLRHVYDKLGIPSTRADLTQAIRPHGSGAGGSPGSGFDEPSEVAEVAAPATGGVQDQAGTG